MTDNIPHGLQAHADAALPKDQNWKQLPPLWAWLQINSKASCDMLISRGTRPGSAVNKMIVEEIRAAKVAMATANGNRGHRDLTRAAPAAKRVASQPAPQKRPAKGMPQPQDMTLLGADEMFWCNNNEDRCVSAPQFNLEDITSESFGFVVVSYSAGKRLVDRFFDESLFSQPCALVFKKLGWDSLTASNNANIYDKYNPTTIMPFFMDTDGVPVAIECIMVQLGVKHVRFADTTECHTVQGQLAESVKVSIQIPDHDGSDDFLKDVKAKFQKKACTVLDKMLYKDLNRSTRKPSTTSGKATQYSVIGDLRQSQLS